MALDKYQRKRDFKKTPEPKPKVKSSRSGRLFVVQKHRARQLHYDFRLELNGVLLSWAIPKGPSLDPKEKRLAVQVEDHPLEYGKFEGTIPEKEYGGGTVMLWDRGEWEPWSDPHESIKKGTLKFNVNGQKLRGGWTLVRLKDKGESTTNWILIKERDDAARSEETFSVINEEPYSVISGLSIPEIASKSEAVWSSTKGQKGKVIENVIRWRRGLYGTRDFGVSKIKGAKKGKMPSDIAPRQAKITKVVPAGDDWLHEVLLVGKRVICYLNADSVSVLADKRDLADSFPTITRALARLAGITAILDGVVTSQVSQQIDGSEINHAIQIRNDDGLQLVAFDLLYCDGYDLRAAPLVSRKELLQKLLSTTGNALAYCEHIEGRGKLVLAEASKLGAAGIVSKHRESTYASRSARDWQVIRAATTSKNEPTIQKKKSRSASSEPSAEVEGIGITHPSKIVYPEERVSKLTLAEYYEAVAERMLPIIKGRPLSLYRCPSGIEGDCFFQKQLGEMKSKHLKDVKEESNPYIVLHDVKGLISLIQWNVMEIHDWGCRADKFESPDRIIFDLDPGPKVPWAQIVEGARGLRLLLEQAGLESFLKTSGGKGLHVVVPLTRGHTWDQAKDFAAGFARQIADVAPKHFTVLISKDQRPGKVYIDYLRNQRGATCAAPYTTRARPGANVSMPIAWEELSAEQPIFNIIDAANRLRVSPDPWTTFNSCKQKLPKPARK